MVSWERFTDNHVTLKGVMKIAYVAIVLALGSTCLSMPARAGLLGSTITASYYYPDLSTLRDGPFDIVVGPTVEISCPPDVDDFCGVISVPFTLDFTDNQIIYQYGPGSSAAFATAPFDGFVFADLDMGAPITGITFSSFGFSELSSSAVSFTGDSVTINLSGAEEGATSGWTVTLQTAVPEPKALELFGAGLLVLLCLRTRHQSRRGAHPQI
jgi:hypothetical protein